MSRKTYWFAHLMPRGEYPKGVYPAAYPVAWQGSVLVLATIAAPILILLALLPVLFGLPDWVIAILLIVIVFVSLAAGVLIAMARTDPVHTVSDYRARRRAAKGGNQSP